MNDILARVAEGVLARVAGPMSLRFICQPVVAILLGIRDGRLDARAGTPPFIFDLLFRPESRKRALGSALKSLLTPMIVGTVLDAVAQYLIFQRVLIVPAMLVGAFVMGVPYSLARGLSHRIARRAQRLKPDPRSTGPGPSDRCAVGDAVRAALPQAPSGSVRHRASRPPSAALYRSGRTP